MPRNGNSLWTLDPAVTFLNHGSFGAAPRPVQDAQREWRRRLESEPVRFFQRELTAALDVARDRLAAFVGADRSDLGFVPNATSGVNAVLRSYPFAPGDEIVLTDHVYNACRNAADYVAGRSGARLVTARVPFPIGAEGDVAPAVLAAVTERTRLVMLEHVTSPTALVLPVSAITAELRARGIDVLIDGAHAPGMIDLDLAAIGATFYAGNCHKWLCAPKGAGFLHVDAAYEPDVVPVVVSHGYNTEHPDRSRFHLLFDWTGTDDPTAYLSVPAALDTMAAIHPGGWPELMARNRALALAARDVLCDRLGVAAPAPDSMIGSMASLPLPDAARPPLPYGRDSLHERLFVHHAIEVPVQLWPQWPQRLLRISAQAYNTIGQYEHLAAVLAAELAAEA